MNDTDRERMYELLDHIATLTSSEFKALDMLQDEYTDYEQVSFGQNLSCFIND